MAKVNRLGVDNLKQQIGRQSGVTPFHLVLTCIVERLNEENYVIGLAEDTSIPAVAWSLRNLSELRIWLRFVCKSEENLDRFTKDFYNIGVSSLTAAMRLVDDLGKRVPDPARRSPEQYRLLAEMKAEREEVGLSDASPLMAKTYASGVKLDKEYGAITALTSPLIHPSALSILSIFNIESYRQHFESFGLILASDIIKDAREHLDQHGYRSASK